MSLRDMFEEQRAKSGSDYQMSERLPLEESFSGIPEEYFEKYADSKVAKDHCIRNFPSTHSNPEVFHCNPSWVETIKGLRDECLLRKFGDWGVPDYDDATRIPGAVWLSLVDRSSRGLFSTRVRRACEALALNAPNLREAVMVGGLEAREAFIMKYEPQDSDYNIKYHSDAKGASWRIASLIMCINPPTGMPLFLFCFVALDLIRLTTCTTGGDTHFPDAIGGELLVAHTAPGVTASFFSRLSDGKTINDATYHTTTPLRRASKSSRTTPKEVLVVFYDSFAMMK